MKTRIFLLAAAVAVIAFPALAAIKAEPKKQSAPPPAQQIIGIETDAADLIRKHANFYLKAKTVTAKINSRLNIETPAGKRDLRGDYTLALERPNRVAFILREGLLGASLVCDGKELATSVAALKRYTVEKSPEKFDGMAEGPGAFELLGLPMITTMDLFKSDPYDRTMAGVITLGIAGHEEVIDGVKCMHLRATQEQFDWDVWIETGATPVIRRLTFDLRKMIGEVPEEFREAAKNLRSELVIDYRDWKFETELPADAFRFTPPKDAEKVDELIPGSTRSGGDGESAALIGKDAPTFKLAQLGADEIDLAAHKGKEVVVLDFWATWCGPCVAALPHVIEVAEKFSDRGVVLYAVNQREAATDIRDFLDERKLEVAVLLDEAGRVGQLYGVEGIPQTVIIGKDGKVTAVHIGYRARLKDDLTAELVKLVGEK